MHYSDTDYSAETNYNDGFYSKPHRPYLPLFMVFVFLTMTLATVKLVSICLVKKQDAQTYTGNQIEQISTVTPNLPSPPVQVQIDSEEQKQKLELRQGQDEFFMAATIWGEARNQGYAGMKAVADVIMNRQSELKSSIQDVVLSPKQFSCWNYDDPNRKLLTAWHLEHLHGEEAAIWSEAKVIAHEEVIGYSTDSTKGALHYHTKAAHPYWSKIVKKYKGNKVIFIKPPVFIAKIGDHVFYH